MGNMVNGTLVVMHSASVKSTMSDMGNMQRTWGYRSFVLSIILNSPYLPGQRGWA